MSRNKNRKLLSIVSPAYNEAENIDEFYSRVLSATENLNLEIEIIYINSILEDYLISTVQN